MRQPLLAHLVELRRRLIYSLLAILAGFAFNRRVMAMGNQEDMLATAAILGGIDAGLADTYAARTGLPAQEIAAMMAKEPVAIQLRYLQTLNEIGWDKNTTIVFPLPMDLIAGFSDRIKKA